MKKLLAVLIAAALGASMAFSQTGGGSTDHKVKGHKVSSHSKVSHKGHKGGKKGHKGGKKSKKGSSGTTPPPK